MTRRCLAALGACLIVLAGALPVAARPSTRAEGRWVPSLPLRQQGSTYLSLFRSGVGYVMHTEGGDNGFLYRTADFGVTYEPRSLPPFGGTGVVEFATAKLGYASGGGFWRTTDGGTTWSDHPAPGVHGFTWTLSVARKGRTIVATGSPQGKGCTDGGPPPLTAFVSHDGGRHWRATSLGFTGWAFDADFVGRHGVILADKVEYDATCSAAGYLSDRVMVTHDGGKTFRKVGDCAPPNEVCSSVAMSSGRHFVIGRTNGTVSVTTNGGQSFKTHRLDGALAPPPTCETCFWISALDFVDGRFGFASTNGRGVWRTQNGGRTWTKEASTQEVFGLGIGDLAASDSQHALAGGPTFVLRRVAPE